MDFFILKYTYIRKCDIFLGEIIRVKFTRFYELFSVISLKKLLR